MPNQDFHHIDDSVSAESQDKRITMQVLFRRAIGHVTQPADFYATDLIWDVDSLFKTLAEGDTAYWSVYDHGTVLAYSRADMRDRLQTRITFRAVYQITRHRFNTFKLEEQSNLLLKT